MDRKLGELRRIKDHFAKFVPEAVKGLVAANPEMPALTKRIGDVSVLFLDISGYTNLSERLAPERQRGHGDRVAEAPCSLMALSC